VFVARRTRARRVAQRSTSRACSPSSRNKPPPRAFADGVAQIRARSTTAAFATARRCASADSVGCSAV
jgi:hypothetical protein